MLRQFYTRKGGTNPKTFLNGKWCFTKKLFHVLFIRIGDVSPTNIFTKPTQGNVNLVFS